MTWTINTNWIAAAERRCMPIGIVRIELQPTTSLRIDDYSVISGSTMTAILNVGGTLYSVNEGTDYSAGASNTACATNIADAILALIPSGGYSVRYLVESDSAGNAILTFILGEAASAATLITFQASVTDEPVGWGFDLGNGPTEAVFCKGQEPFIGTDGIYPNIVTDIRGLEMSVDPLTREIGLGTPEIDFNDTGASSGIRRLMHRYMLFGRYVDIYVGFDGLAESDFERWPRAYIQKVTPKRGGAITLSLGDGLHELTTGTITGEWVGMHPLQVVEDLLASFVTPDRYESSTLDPTDAAYDEIGHWVVSRYNDEEYQCVNGISDPTQGLEVLNSVLVMLNGTLRPYQNGVFRFDLLDESAAAVRSFVHSSSLTESLYPCNVTAYSDAYEGLINKASVNFAQSRDGDSPTSTYQEMDNASVRETLRVVQTTLDLEWCNGVAEIYAAYMEPGGVDGSVRRMFTNTEQIVIKYAPRQGFCGTRQIYDASTSSFSPASNSDLTSTRVAFLRAEGRAYASTSTFEYTTDPEIIAFDGVGHFFFDAATGPQYLDDGIANRARPDKTINQYSDILLPTTYETLANTWMEARFDVATTYNDFDFTAGRGGLGTTAAAARDGGLEVTEEGINYYAPIRVVDVTIPVDIAKRWLRRCRFGMPTQTIEVGARHYDLELSDVVTVSDDDQFLAFVQPGTPTSGVTTSFEVVRKRCRLFEADPCMEFDLAFLRSTAYPITDVVPIYDPTVSVLEVSTVTDFIVDDSANMVMNDHDGDGAEESYTIRG